MWDVFTAFFFSLRACVCVCDGCHEGTDAQGMKYSEAELFNQPPPFKTSQLNQGGSVIIHPQ